MLRVKIIKHNLSKLLTWTLIISYLSIIVIFYHRYEKANSHVAQSVCTINLPFIIYEIIFRVSGYWLIANDVN